MVRILLASCLLMASSCSAVRLPAYGMQVRNALPVPDGGGSGYPQNIQVFSESLSGYDVSRFLSPVEWSRDDPDAYIFDSAFYMDNVYTHNVEWVLTSMWVEYTNPNNVLNVEVKSAVFRPYYSSQLQYGTFIPTTESAPFAFIVADYPNSTYSLATYTTSYYGAAVWPSNHSRSAGDNAPYWTPTGAKKADYYNSTGSGPYKCRLYPVNYQGANYSAASMLDRLAANLAASIQTYAGETVVAEERGYRKGWNIGHDVGYQEGYRDGSSEGESGNSLLVIPTLFGALANVPISILNGMSGFAIWDVSIITIIFTFLFIAIILWVIRRFI